MVGLTKRFKIKPQSALKRSSSLTWTVMGSLLFFPSVLLTVVRERLFHSEYEGNTVQ